MKREAESTIEEKVERREKIKEKEEKKIEGGAEIKLNRMI